jgi:hypothetical protein
MPWNIQQNNGKFCVHKENEPDPLHCYDTEQEAKDYLAALYASEKAVKAVGDWELEVCAVPFGPDRDKQSFDADTDFMLGEFPTPVITYHHGIEPGKQGIQGKPAIIGKTTRIEKRADGIWIRVLLDKALDLAKRVWEAAKQGLVVASSDSIAHLARLDVNGKTRMYDKGTPGRIGVWPLAGVSLWDAVPGNFQPASPNAIALPVMKAVYREAGLDFPEIDSTGGDPGAEKAAGRARAEQAKAKKILSKTKKLIEV